MLQSFKSAFLLMALEYILMNGLQFAENYCEENEATVEKAIKDLIPGEDFDALGWGIVKALLPRIFEIAAVLIDKIDGTESPVERHALMIKAIRGVTV